MINGRLALVLEREYGYIIWYGMVRDRLLQSCGAVGGGAEIIWGPEGESFKIIDFRVYF